jgi:predicted component of type VI protein secretion system
MRYRLETPVAGVTTDIGPVHFHLGVAEVDEAHPNVPQVIAYCRNNGYGVHELDEPAAEAEVGDDDNNPVTPPPASAKVEVWREHCVALGATEADVDGLTKDQLKELAAELAKKDGDQQ